MSGAFKIRKSRATHCTDERPLVSRRLRGNHVGHFRARINFHDNGRLRAIFAVSLRDDMGYSRPRRVQK